MDLLPFQAGSYASNKEEVEYLDTEHDVRLIRGVQLEAPEEDYDVAETTDDTVISARSQSPGKRRRVLQGHTPCR